MLENLMALGRLRFEQFSPFVGGRSAPLQFANIAR
jgi:hypothetical protein